MIIDIDTDDRFKLLSNFSENHFEVQGVLCYSMEGFLQSLKFSDSEKQVQVCKLVGKKAKFVGKKQKWWQTQVLFWKGVPISRHSYEYQGLIEHAFECLSGNKEFSKTLLQTENYEITHSSGKNDPYRTILTQVEFVSRLYKIREQLKTKK